MKHEIRLFHAGQSRATRVRWMLEELEVPYELVPVSLRGPRFERDPELLRVSPYGTVPGLEVDGVRMFESGAMLIWLADRFMDKGFAPPLAAPERCTYLNWIAFTCTTLETPLWQLARHNFVLPEADRVRSVGELAKREWADIAPIVTRELGGREHAVGDRFSAADVVLTHTLLWAGAAKLLVDHPELAAWAARHRQRPAYMRAAAK